MINNNKIHPIQRELAYKAVREAVVELNELFPDENFLDFLGYPDTLTDYFIEKDFVVQDGEKWVVSERAKDDFRFTSTEIMEQLKE